LGEGSRVVKKLSRGCRERLRHKLWHQGAVRGAPSKAAGLHLVVLESEPLEEILAQSSLGAGQPAEVSQVVAHLLDEFHLLIQEVLPQEVQAWGSMRAEPRACRPTSFRFFRIMAASLASRV